MKNSEKLIQEKYNGVHPTCQCGCGEKTVYDYNKKDFGSFKRGHQVRVNPNYFGDPKNPKRIEKIKSTRKSKFKNGEYDHILKAIKDSRKDPNLGEKISKGSKGVPKPKPQGFGYGRKHSQSTKEKMSQSAIQRVIEKDQPHSSRLEEEFCGVLNQLKVTYSRFFYSPEIKAFYDFFIPSKNIIIEIDGDFWHCNPKTHPTPEYECQKRNLIRDKEKNKWAKNQGFKLIRIWEYDIKNNIDKVISSLKKELI